MLLLHSLQGLGDGPIAEDIFTSDQEEILRNLDQACGKEMLGDVFIQLRCRMQLLALSDAKRAGKEQHLKLTLELGSTYQDLHEYSLAMPMLEEALNGFIGLKGPVDKMTLMCFHTLGAAHMRMGDFDKSIELSQRALRGREKLFGKSHQDTLRTINNLAMAYYSVGDYSEASSLYERALEAWAGQLGWKHTNTLMTCNG